MDIQLHWYETIMFLHHQWLMWWVAQSDLHICETLQGPVFIGKALAHARIVAWVMCSPALLLATLKSSVLNNAYTASYGTALLPNQAAFALANYGHLVPCTAQLGFSPSAFFWGGGREGKILHYKWTPVCKFGVLWNAPGI